MAGAAGVLRVERDPSWHVGLLTATGTGLQQRCFRYGRQEITLICSGVSSLRGRSSMVERQLPKLHTRVRFPSPAPALSFNRINGFATGFASYVRSLALLS